MQFFMYNSIKHNRIIERGLFMYNNKIPYGLLDNEYVSPQDIPTNISGTACGCLCPQCKKPLVLVKREGKRHFRHKSDEIHCHYDINYHSLEYVWVVLEESGFLEEFSLTMEDLIFFQAKANELKNLTSQEKSHQEQILGDVRKNTKINYIDRTFKLSIKNEEYFIKLLFNTDNEELEGNMIVIDLGKIMKGEDLFNSKREDIVNTVQGKLEESFSEIIKRKVRNVQLEEEKIRSDKESKERIKIAKAEKLKRQIEEKKEKKTLDDMLNKPIKVKGEILKYYDKKCPLCGARMCSMKVRIGATVACENYPECDYGAGNYNW